MSNLTKNLMCISMRNGIDIWLEEERVKTLKTFLKTAKGFIELGDEMINSVDIIGIFSAKTMEEQIRRKNGEWKCKFGNWHKKGQDCTCQEKKEENVTIYGQEEAQTETIIEDGVEKVRFI